MKRKWADWSTAQRIGWSAIAAVLAIGLIAALASPSEEKAVTSPPPAAETTITNPEPSPAPEPPPPISEPPPPPPAGPSPAIRAWAGDVAPWARSLADAFSEMGTLLQDSNFTTRLMLGDQDATIQFAVPLATMSACWQTFPKPPSERKAQRIGRTVLQACRFFRQSATLFAEGVDNNNADQITDAALMMRRGVERIQAASAQVEALS
jgi:hypothetical protein